MSKKALKKLKIKSTTWDDLLSLVHITEFQKAHLSLVFQSDIEVLAWLRSRWMQEGRKQVQDEIKRALGEELE